MNKRLLVLAVATMLIVSCSNNTHVISGKLTNSQPETYLRLDQVKSNELVTVDSVMLDESGSFSFKRESEDPMFYVLRVHNESFLTVIIEPGEKLEIVADYDSLNIPVSAKGAVGTETMLQYNKALNFTLEKMSALSDIYMQNIENPELEKVMEELNIEAEAIIDEAVVYTKKYIDDNLTSLVSLFMLYQQVSPGMHIMHPLNDMDYFIKVDSSLFTLYPNSEPVIALHEQVNEIRARVAEETAGTESASAGAVAPEIALPSVKGDTIKLSSTRGKIVLLDFWAAWCPPCRKESPYLVAAYDKYNSKGFEIFQVSLDKTRQDWIKGIEEDKLGRWIHVSDVMYWNSIVVPLYKIESIPFNVLLDREGRIIDSNLRGERLEEVLETLLK
jgi:thiol-disulfide isomerase/thioredoxin